MPLNFFSFISKKKQQKKPPKTGYRLALAVSQITGRSTHEYSHNV